MYKTKSKSMQRGAGKSRKKRLTLREEYEQTQIILTEKEKLHFGQGIVCADFVANLRPTIKNLAMNRFRKPRDVSRLLNTMHISTAIGEKWTPRLAWFLLDLLFNDKSAHPNKATLGKALTNNKAVAKVAAQRRSKLATSKTEKPEPPRKAPEIIQPGEVEPREIVPLTDEERATRIRVLQRHLLTVAPDSGADD